MNSKYEFLGDFELYFGDCLDHMNAMVSETIQLTVTSPPYDELRDYEKTIEWGPEIWEKVIKELYRITKPGGVVVWIVGDQTKNFTESLSSFKQALFFKEVGFNCYDTMIWEKSGVPLNHRRYQPAFEYMFVFSKGFPEHFNPIMTKKKWFDNRTEMQIGRERDGSVKSKRKARPDIREVKLTNVWKIPNIIKISETGGHPAPFPVQLVKNHIVTWTEKGDIVYDPYLGSGTSGEACHLLGRVLKGSEKVEKYFNRSVKMFDSEIETRAHIAMVNLFMKEFAEKLKVRGAIHDVSKLMDPEKPIFDEFTPKLKDSVYGSDEYKQFLKDMNPALVHHYAENRHHPEHFEDGVNDMDILDFVEMVFDWKAASMRHETGSFKKSIAINKERFGLSDQIVKILENTANNFNW